MNRRATTTAVGLSAGLALAAAVALPTAGSATAARPEPTTSSSTATATPTATSRPTITRGVRASTLVVAGTLAAVDPAAQRITVMVRGGRDKAVRGQDVVLALTTSTVVRQDGRLVTASELRTGAHVTVQCTRAADGSLAAARVTVAGGGGSPTSSPTGSPTSSPTSSPS